MRKRWPLLLFMLVPLTIALTACQSKPTIVMEKLPTSATPASGAPAGKIVMWTDTFFMTYYTSVWALRSHDATSVRLLTTTKYGDVLLAVRSSTVADGTTADALLASWMKKYVTPAQFQGIKDYGVIHGAEIGYVAGVGHSYMAILKQSNAPATPVYLQVIAATRGTTGLVLSVLTTLDAKSPDPTQQVLTGTGVYDQITNSVRWR